MKQIHLIVVAFVLALCMAVPLVAAFTQAPARSSVTLVAQGPISTPTWSTNGPTPCTSGGC